MEMEVYIKLFDYMAELYDLSILSIVIYSVYTLFMMVAIFFAGYIYGRWRKWQDVKFFNKE